MGNVYISLGSGGGGIDPDELTGTVDKGLSGYTFGVKGNDEPVSGTMPDNGAWSSAITINGRANIPAGYHNGYGYVNQSINDRGAWATSLGINGRINIPEGYHNGNGYVNQSIPVYGGGTYYPQNYIQTANIAGWYNSGNITIAPVTPVAAGNLRAGVNHYGVVGTMQDYSYLIQAQTSF